MSKIDAYRLNVKKIENSNHIYVGDIAGVVSIIRDFTEPTDTYTPEVRLEVKSSKYKGAWIIPALAFIFEKGLVIDKLLMREGKYYGIDYGYRGRYVNIDKNKYDKNTFQKICNLFQSLDRSQSRAKRIYKVKLTNALKTYNESLL